MGDSVGHEDPTKVFQTISSQHFYGRRAALAPNIPNNVQVTPRIDRSISGLGFRIFSAPALATYGRLYGTSE